MSNDLSISIALDDGDRVYFPGETLSGRYWIDSRDPQQIKAVEASVLWHTRGKGDEDMAVHDFWRRYPDENEQFNLRRPELFSTTLPNTPLSYDGRVVKLHWSVRVRVISHRGKDAVKDAVFRLGDVKAVGDLPEDSE